MLRGSAADPLNLLQVMLAKGTVQFIPPAFLDRNAREYMLLPKVTPDQADPTGSGLSTINSPNHKLLP